MPAARMGAATLLVMTSVAGDLDSKAGTARLQRIVFTSSEVTSSTSAAGLTWVADELDGVGTFAAGSNHVAVHHISWTGQPVDIETVGYGAGLIWALGEETNYLTSLTHPTNVGVVTTLDPETGGIVDQWPISAQASALVLGNGSAYVSDENNGRLLRLTPPRGLQILRGPRAAELTAVTSHALWAISKHGQLLRIGVGQH